MQIGSAQRGNRETCLVHIFGRGLDDERYVVECFRSMANGEIRPVPIAAPAVRRGKSRTRHTVTSLSNVKQMTTTAGCTSARCADAWRALSVNRL